MELQKKLYKRLNIALMRWIVRTSKNEPRMGSTKYQDPEKLGFLIVEGLTLFIVPCCWLER